MNMQLQYALTVCAAQKQTSSVQLAATHTLLEAIVDVTFTDRLTGESRKALQHKHDNRCWLAPNPLRYGKPRLQYRQG